MDIKIVPYEEGSFEDGEVLIDDVSISYLQKNDLYTKMVFIHIPYLKNIDDTDSFFTKIIETISRIR